jgi:hypothetical protein
MFGIKYYHENEEDRFTGDDGSTKEETTAYGILLGYDADALMVAASYLLEGEKENGSGDQVYSEGSGYSVDLAYFFDVKGIGIGPHLSLVSLDFKKRLDDGRSVEGFKLLHEQKLIPYIAARLQF